MFCRTSISSDRAGRRLGVAAWDATFAFTWAFVLGHVALALAWQPKAATRPRVGAIDRAKPADTEEDGPVAPRPLETSAITEAKPTRPKRGERVKRNSGSAQHSGSAQPRSGEERDQELPRDIRVARFQEIAPGETVSATLERTLGDPMERRTNEGTSYWVYKVGPFPRVEFAIVDDVVTSIIAHLESPLPPERVADELGLMKFKPLTVRDADGQPLGQVYPERGVLLSYSPDHDGELVGHVVLEPISAEPFLMRVEQDREFRFRANLADLNYVLELDPKNARALRWKAELLEQLGREEEALASIEETLEQTPDDQEAVLLRARLLALTGHREDAVRESELVMKDPHASDLLRAIAFGQLAWLALDAPNPLYTDAVDHAARAIELALPEAKDDDVRHRRVAKKVLIEAHLTTAVAIARGRWQKKNDVVPRWLEIARQIAEGLIEFDQGDPAIRVQVQRQTLAAQAAMPTAFDPVGPIDQLVTQGNAVAAECRDPLRRQFLEWQLGSALLDGAQAQRAQGRAEEALLLVEQAARLLESAGQGREKSPRTEYRLGHAHYLLGVIEAVSRNDHQRAVAAYKRARQRFPDPLPDCGVAKGAHGERLVSMGVSFWHSGDRRLGMQLTRDGMELMEAAVREEGLDRQALAVPYNNLASMHRRLGNTSETKEFASRAAKLENGNSQGKRR